MFFFIERERWNRQVVGNHLGDRAFSCCDRSDEYDRFHYREYIRPCAAPHIESFKKSASCSASPLPKYRWIDEVFHVLMSCWGDRCRPASPETPASRRQHQ